MSPLKTLLNAGFNEQEAHLLLTGFVPPEHDDNNEQLGNWLAHCVKTTRDMTLILAVANGSYQVRFHNNGVQFSPRVGGILQ